MARVVVLWVLVALAGANVISSFQPAVQKAGGITEYPCKCLAQVLLLHDRIAKSDSASPCNDVELHTRAVFLLLKSPKFVMRPVASISLNSSSTV
ncbi:Protein of unknown function [Gryllus bimaculatus]|nr:Protein of unknown function [Gryllus bimaculatus]